MNVKRYGVIVCSSCKRAWGVDLTQKTTRCIQCRKTYTISQRKIIYHTSDLKKLRIYIAKINKKLV
jgi:acetyl-CoA carboxylase beta subunit